VGSVRLCVQYVLYGKCDYEWTCRYVNWFTEQSHGHLSKEVEAKIVNFVVPCILDRYAS